MKTQSARRGRMAILLSPRGSTNHCVTLICLKRNSLTFQIDEFSAFHECRLEPRRNLWASDRAF